MIKKMMVLAVALVLATTSMVSAQKVAHINSQELMEQYPKSKVATDSLKVKQKEAEETLKQMQEILMKRVEEYKAKAADPATPKSTLGILEEDIREFEDRIYKTEDQLKIDLQNLQNALFKPIYDDIKKAVGEVSKEMGINYVFDIGAMIYYEGGTDLQPMVKKKLGIPETP